MNNIEGLFINCMSIFKYCYNICFIIFFAVVMSRCSVTYGMTQARSFKLLGELFLVYIVESVYVELMEILYVVSPEADILLSTGVDIYISGLISAAEVYVFIRFIDSILERQDRKGALAGFAAVILMTVIGYNADNAAGGFLIFNLYSIPLLCTSAYFLYEVRCFDAEKRLRALKYRRIINFTVIFSMLTIAENFLCIILYGADTDRALQFFERRISYSDDAFSVVLGVAVMWIADRIANEHMAETIEAELSLHMAPVKSRLMRTESELKSVRQKNAALESSAERVSVMQLRSDSAQLADFCRSFSLTDRESDILRLLIEGKTNQEIADSLLISVGTVKAHVHSIYGKLEVTRRSQLMNVFSTYEVKGGIQ